MSSVPYDRPVRRHRRPRVSRVTRAATPRRSRRACPGRPGTASSTRKPSPTTAPPRRSTSRAVAEAVPPVASTSSTTSTRSPGAPRRGGSPAVGAVLEGVLLAGDRPGQLARLADRHEAGTEPVGDRGGEDEAAGLDAEHVHRSRRRGSRRPGRRPPPRRPSGVAEQRRDVLEGHPGLGPVRDVADEGLESGLIDRHGSGAQRRLPFLRGRGGIAPGGGPGVGRGRLAGRSEAEPLGVPASSAATATDPALGAASPSADSASSAISAASMSAEVAGSAGRTGVGRGAPGSWARAP